MKIAYIIQAHKNFEQIRGLVKKLQGNIESKIDIYIHIDSKSKELKKKLLNFYIKNEDVIVLEETINVNWSGFSQVKATLLTLEKIIESEENYKYISLLSGECYPLKTAEEIYEALIKTNFEYIEFEKNEKYNWRLEQYCFFTEKNYNRKIYIKILNKILKMLQNILFIRRKNFKNIIIYKGSQWFTLSRDAVKFILEKTYTENLIEKYKYTNCPDEHYFQNILCNSKFLNKIINNNLRYIEWDGKSSPKIFLKEDIKNIAKVSNKLFIRKIKFKENKEK